MNLGRLICVFRGHAWGRWATKQKFPDTHPVPWATDPYGERKCKRCGKVENGPAPKKRTRREPNAADTIQGQP